MANTTQLHVTACDNELYILASTQAGSSELCHLKSGFNDPVNYSFNPGHILPPGSYNLTIKGINWGGPWKFQVVATPPISALGGLHSGDGKVGDVWDITVPITVGP
jgi:hypothetical protein